MNAGEAVGRKRRVVLRVKMRGADENEDRERDELDDHHDVVGGRALARAAQQQPGDHHDDRERRQMNQDRNAGDAWRRREKAVNLRIRAQQRRPVARRQPDRQLDTEAAYQRVEVVAPRDRDGDIADGVFQDQVPADDPRDELAQRGVGIRVRAARLRNHRRQFRVAQTGERAGTAKEQKRKHERRSGAHADHLAVRTDLAGGRRADRAEDSGADHRADGEHDQIAGTERALQAVGAVRVLDQRRDRLPLKQLRHRARLYPGSG